MELAQNYIKLGTPVSADFTITSLINDEKDNKSVEWQLQKNPLPVFFFRVYKDFTFRYILLKFVFTDVVIM